MSLLVGDKLIVSMHYKLSDDDGNLLDSSEGSDPLAYLHGAGNIIPGLENALVGKAEGSKSNVRIEPAEGYGEIIPDLVLTVSKSAFEGVDSIEVGMQFQSQGSDGQVRLFEVKEVEGEEVTIDGNHALAGIPLNFEVEIIEIREATAEEIDHGHVH